MLKNPPVSTFFFFFFFFFFFGQTFDNSIRVFILFIDIHKVVPHATLVHRDLIVYKKYANLVINISLQSQDSVNYEPLLPHLLRSVISPFIKFDI